MPIYPHDERTYQIIGAAMEVHRNLHRGLLEKLYCEALAVEFELRAIPFDDRFPCQLFYKNRPLSGHYCLDFLCYREVVVEVKAVSGLTPADEAQLLNYLALSHKPVGLLVNTGRPRRSNALTPTFHLTSADVMEPRPTGDSTRHKPRRVPKPNREIIDRSRLCLTSADGV